MQSGKQMHESPEYDALIFRPAVSLPIRAGTGGKKRKKEERKSRENGQGTRLYITSSIFSVSRKKATTLSSIHRGG